MKLASFSVVTKDHQRYCANGLTVGMRNGVRDNIPGMVSTLSFICSGVMTTVDADVVETVEYHETGSYYCDFCDNYVSQFVGTGVFKNDA